MVLKEFKELQAHRVLPDHKVHKDLQVQQVHKEHKETRVKMVD